MPKPAFPVSGVSYNVRPNGGVASDKKYLSCTEGGFVDLYDEIDADNPGRQYWVFTKVDGAGDDVYYIKPAGNVNADKAFLSASKSGETVDLYEEDDGSNRQRWRLIPNDGGWFQINIVGGIENERVVFSCSHGGTVDLYEKQDGSGRQQWKLVPEDVEFTELVYDGARASIAARPDFLDTVTLHNEGSSPQQMTAHFTRRVSETSTYENETSFSVSLTATTVIKAPGVSESISATMMSGKKWTFGKSETLEDTRSYDFPVLVPAFTTMVAEVRVAMQKVDIPYVARGISKKFNQEVEIKGIWRGVTAGDIFTGYHEKSAFAIKAADNITYRIKPRGGVGGNNTLTWNAANGTINLAVANGADQQRWWLQEVDTDTYHIRSRGTADAGTNYLEGVADGGAVRLAGGDDNSGRARWKAVPTNDGAYTIEASAGVGARKYLSCTPDGAVVDLWSEDDKSGRQRWVLERQ
jgi:hypothetical protein